MQNRIAELARQHDIPIMGPNCQGFIDHFTGVAATFTGALIRKDFHRGPVSFVSQSGAMGYHFYGMAQAMGIGFNYMISSGNEAVVTTSDYLRHVLEDEQTGVAAAYMEGLSDPATLRDCARLAGEKDKPLLVMKVGRQPAGSRAASSHTGSLAGEDRLVDTLFRQEGILRVDHVGQFFDLFKAFSSPKRLKSDRIAILSISGGAGVVMADDCEALGMRVMDFTPETERKLTDLLPDFGSARNPVDLTAQVLGQPEQWYDSIKCVVDDPNTDAVVVFIGLLEHMKDVLIPPLVKIDRETDKPILVTWMACDDPIRRDFTQAGVPLYEEPHRCMFALSMLNQYRLIREKRGRPGAGALDSAPLDPNELLKGLDPGSQTLNEVSSKMILQRAQLPIPNEYLAITANEAASSVKRIGKPVVMKVVSRDLPHKSDIGGVIKNVSTPEEAAEAFERILSAVAKNRPDAKVDGVLVSEMIDAEVELIVGLKNDPVFGPVIMTGLGGIFVEIFKDVSTRILPVGPAEAREMIEELKAYPLLVGARGGRAKDVEAVVDFLVRVGHLGVAMENQLAELDVNPLMVLDRGKGVKAVDALVSLK